MKVGDAAILKEIINIFRNEKIKTVSSTIYTPELNLMRGNYSKYRPDKRDKVDIKNALNKLSNSDQYSHIQEAISRDNLVVLRNKKKRKKYLKKIKR